MYAVYDIYSGFNDCGTANDVVFIGQNMIDVYNLNHNNTSAVYKRTRVLYTTGDYDDLSKLDTPPISFGSTRAAVTSCTRRRRRYCFVKIIINNIFVRRHCHPRYFIMVLIVVVTLWLVLVVIIVIFF